MVQVARQHPPLPESDVLEAKAQHLAAAQPAQHHGVDHDAVALGAQRIDEDVHLGRAEDRGRW